MSKLKSPLALFDSLDNIKHCYAPLHLTALQKQEFDITLDFLKNYVGSLGTFNSYRREIERLLHWCWWVEKKNLKDLKREHIESFVRFCQNPPANWIGTKKAERFIEKDEQRIPNPQWRPFVATITKAAHRQGEQPDISAFSLSQGAIKQLFAILSTFYNYLLQDEFVFMNPVALIRQKSKFIRKHQGQAPIRRLSSLQWEYVIASAQQMAETLPATHERTLFIMSALYSLYLRISELTANPRWIPMMNHFKRDSSGHWWFTTVGKGNKERQIAVSNDMLNALKRWRGHLGLSSLPTPADTAPLLPKTKGPGAITNSSYLRKVVQQCFDQAILALKKDGFVEEAETLVSATVHWLRHTGISDDVKRRPREHVRDDAGHSSSATTDKYIDIELQERHRTARNKRIKP